MTSLASVILSGAKNLNSCRTLARKSQTDPPPENVIERAVALETTDHLTLTSLPLQIRGGNDGGRPPGRVIIALPPEGIELDATVSNVEKDLMLQALERFEMGPDARRRTVEDQLSRLPP